MSIWDFCDFGNDQWYECKGEGWYEEAKNVGLEMIRQYLIDRAQESFEEALAITLDHDKK